MEKNIVNPEFPHSCTVRRVSGVSPFSSDAREEIIYAGPCRREASANIRSFSKGTSTAGQQISVDYRVCIPGTFPVSKGDIADVDFLIGADSAAIVTQTNASSLKTSRYPDGRTEFYYSMPQN